MIFSLTNECLSFTSNFSYKNSFVAFMKSNLCQCIAVHAKFSHGISTKPPQCNDNFKSLLLIIGIFLSTSFTFYLRSIDGRGADIDSEDFSFGN